MKKNHTLILILTILLAFIITNGLFSLSSIKDFGKETFSTKRVIEDLKVIAKEPHSVAHPEEKDKVLNYLKAQLESLGGETQIYVYPNIKARQFTFDAKNVLATFPPSKASEDTTYLMMVAHYDSCQPWKKKGKTYVSMGASDDGYGLGVILECIRQALKYREDWHQGIIVLFTDGEEVDLQGMKAAYKYNKEIFHNVGLIINAESRGPFGPTLLFETSPGNEKLIKLYAEYAQCPFAYSLTNLVYQQMPNGTDFNIVRDSIPGFNFSPVADIVHYHTDLDNIQNISVKTIQNYGRQITPVVQAYLTNKDYADKDYFLAEEDAVYFSIPLLGVFHFSKNHYWLLNIGVLFLFLHLIFRDRNFRWKDTFKQSGILLGISLVSIIAGEAIAWLSATLCGVRFRMFGVISGIPFDNAAIIFSMLLLVMAMIRYYRRLHSILQNLYSSLFMLMTLSFIALIAAEENMMFFIPYCIGILTLTLWKATQSRWFPLLGMFLILLHTFSFVYILAMALTIGALGLSLLVAFCNLIVVIPLAKGYLTDKASGQTP